MQNLIILTIIYLILVNGGSFLAIKFDKKIEQTLIMFIFCIIGVLYIPGFFNKLNIGIYILEILSIGLLIWNLILWKKQGNKIWKNIITPGFIAFTLFYLLFFILHHNRMFYNWDDFSHWGDVVKAMFDTNGFSTTATSLSHFKSYPPATALFEYFFVKIGGTFTESNIFIAAHILTVSFFLPLFSKFTFKDIGKNIIIFISVLIIPTIFSISYYKILQVDILLGITFAYLMMLIYVNKEYDLFYIINMSLTLFFLVLLKDTGLFFAIMAIIYAMIKYKWIDNKKLLENNIARNSLFLFIGIILLTKSSWNFSININKVTPMWDMPIDLKELFKTLIGKSTNYRGVVYNNFLMAIINKNILESFISLDLFKIFTIIFLVFYLLSKNKKEEKITFNYLLIILPIYLFGLLVLYLFSFMEYEAVNIASFPRYISTYLVAILSFIFGYIVLKKKEYLTSIFVTLLLFAPTVTIYQAYIDKNNEREIRTTYIEKAEYIKSLVEPESKIYLIIQNTTGYDYWVMRHSLRPNIVNENYTWSIGEKYYEGDIWTNEDMTKEEWINKLVKEYDYVYLYKVDSEFEEQYKDLFESDIKPETLYKVKNFSKKLIEVSK